MSEDELRSPEPLTEAERQAVLDEIEARAAELLGGAGDWEPVGLIPGATSFRIEDPGEKIDRALSWYRWYGPAPWRQPDRPLRYLLPRETS